MAGLTRRGALAGAAGLAAPAAAAASRPPNIVLVLADDLGWGDLGAYGQRLISTPNLDRLARQGVRMTDFYAAANLCTPSRAGLLTGRYPIRTGLAHEVIQASDKNGLPLSEVTIAEALKPAYATALVGKWHLGHVAPFWPPTVQGFDLFFGLPYSHDMKPLGLFTAGPGVELTREDVDFPHLTERFFARGEAFIGEHRAQPFFLMLALTAPHAPLQPDPAHAGRSPAGNYGDVVQEVDRGVGSLLAKIKALGLDRDTVVIVTSDNGPWFEGSTGGLRERKGGGAWDGGYRVPFMVRAPGRIPAGRTTHAVGSGIDLLPTICSLAGRPAPAGVTLDGSDLLPVWTHGAPTPHDALILFNNEQVAGLRTQRWKLVVRSYYRSLDLPIDRFGYPLLFDLDIDPSESFNVAARHPEVLKALLARIQAAKAQFEPLGVRKYVPSAYEKAL